MNLHTELLEQIPHLRAFAGSLAGRGKRADDLVQETLVKAWDKLSSAQHGTSTRARLFTILRNAYIDDFRHHDREAEVPDATKARQMSVPSAQCEHLEFAELCTALQTLSPYEREALILIDASGFSYAESASIANCAIGRFKSRVDRARARLSELLPPKDLPCLDRVSVGPLPLTL